VQPSPRIFIPAPHAAQAAAKRIRIVQMDVCRLRHDDLVLQGLEGSRSNKALTLSSVACGSTSPTITKIALSG
jgi:hypothetical protein